MFRRRNSFSPPPWHISANKKQRAQRCEQDWNSIRGSPCVGHDFGRLGERQWIWQQQAERLLDGVRKAGVPEG